MARSFADGSDSNPYQEKTIFLIDPQSAKINVDISWMSFFPEEQEVIIQVDRCAPLYDPRQFMKCAKTCKEDFNCHHARSALKEITLVDQNLVKNYFEKRKTRWIKQMKAVVSNFKTKLPRFVFYASDSWDDEEDIAAQKRKVKQLEMDLEQKDLKHDNWMKVVERLFSVRSLFQKIKIRSYWTVFCK